MALCGNEILFGYTITFKGTIVVPPYSIFSTGTYNSKSYYTWYDATSDLDYILRWNIGGYWELGYEDAGFNQIAFLDIAETDCPVDPLTASDSWFITTAGWTNINTALGDALPVVLTEEQECFEILIWNKQCEFAQCVLKYLQLLQFGSAPCEALEHLKNQKRILTILNCYDVRDIPDNTTDYNIFTYQEMKNFLNY